MKGVIKWLWIMTVLGIWVEVNGCLEQEKAALLQLKKNVGDQLPFIFRSVWLLDYLESWKEDKTSNCCDDWEGVTCGLNSRVVSLSLESPNLGHLSEMHFNASVLHPFEELRELNLTSMGIKSWDEDKGASKLSSKLKSLESLNLQYNNFDASSLSQLHGFLSLKYLFLDENNLEGLQLHDIEAISQNLEELGLRGTEITGFQNNNGSTKLSSSLKVLDLSQNMLDNNIISQLSGFQSLHTLNLRANQLRGVVPLKGSTNLSSSLKVLDLSYTTLDNNIISQLSGFQSLHTLYLRHSQLSGNVPINALHQLRNLEVLDLSENNINGVSNYNGTVTSSPII
ncbi:probably inactive leucine-rich repeat receptor-like protein kinase At2g25790 [Chenopodium quinoa]|uniref:probably inactive leucine-rich repeat receptor-like protein kinase At2g25790 n=1 Tax=Chenopodium quinoa TaxID=63459 RepID=UPI000B791001|nr:probably inactive leucine-rich repeat receptor-like protein kinase At2g25790 [Chenopodium quinoa]